MSAKSTKKAAEAELAELNRRIEIAEHTIQSHQTASAQLEKHVAEMRAEESKLYDTKRKLEVDVEAMQAKMRDEQSKLRVADALNILMGAFYEAGFEVMRRRYRGGI